MMFFMNVPLNRSARPGTRRGLLTGALGVTLLLSLTACFDSTPGTPPVSRTCDLTPDQWSAVEAAGHSPARVWDELALNAVRNVLPQPTVHARTLYHLSAAMYDTWASYDPGARGVYVHTKQTGSDADRDVAVEYAARRVLRARFAQTVPGLAACFDDHLRHAGLDPAADTLTGDTPAATGNRVGQQILDATLNDGSNEANAYADTSGYTFTNAPLHPEQRGIDVQDPDHWQRLQLLAPFTQNGIRQQGPQPFMGAHWGSVQPFAMTRTGTYWHDPGPAPSVHDPRMRERWIPDLLAKQAALDPARPDALDASPAHLGNDTLGTNDGTGHPLNPVTGAPYAPNTLLRADYGRAIAEFWADGPRSETPPGHWNVIANSVTDTPGFQRRLGGTGPLLDPLEWDVKLYLALNGALHDAAISAWDIKRRTDAPRPISLVRYLAREHQLLPQDGVTETRDGTLMVHGWNLSFGTEDPLDWVPYQRNDFVSPAFPGFISGHSTFSRAAAEVLTDLTGSAYFPGGLHDEVLPTGFIRTSSPTNMQPIHLQWATYFDAADQSGQSRIWGGIHIEPDDLSGRLVGHTVGRDAVTLARTYFEGQNTRP